MTELALKAAALDAHEMEDWFAGKAPRRLLAVPFGGPIAGRDMDAEYFSERTDIKPDWFEQRPALWHHGRHPEFGADLTVIGKADRLGSFDGTLGESDEDGWWVDFWFKQGVKRVNAVKALAARGAELFGSTGTFPHMVKKSAKGEILVWPYIEQTLSTSPSNTFSTFRSAKAALDDFTEADISVVPALRELLAGLDTVSSLQAPSGMGEPAAKAGRELSGANLDEIEEWIAALDAVSQRAITLGQRVRSKYRKPEPAVSVGSEGQT